MALPTISLPSPLRPPTLTHEVLPSMNAVLPPNAAPDDENAEDSSADEKVSDQDSGSDDDVVMLDHATPGAPLNV